LLAVSLVAGCWWLLKSNSWLNLPHLFLRLQLA
jgi:hypothetical protein